MRNSTITLDICRCGSSFVHNPQSVYKLRDTHKNLVEFFCSYTCHRQAEKDDETHRYSTVGASSQKIHAL